VLFDSLAGHFPKELVLRPVSDGNFEVVGEAYVHGFMRGECFDDGSCEL
jgi:hypothetical protein